MKSWMIGLLTALLILGATGLALAEANDREFYVKVSMQNFGLEDDFQWSALYATEDKSKVVAVPKLGSHNGAGLTIGERIGRIAGELSFYRTGLPTSFQFAEGGNVFHSSDSDCDLISLDFKYYFVDPRENNLALYGLLGYSHARVKVDDNVGYFASDGTLLGSDDSKFDGSGYNAGIGFLYQFDRIALDGAILYNGLRFDRIKFGGTEYKPDPRLKSSTTVVRLGAVYRF